MKTCTDLEQENAKIQSELALIRARLLESESTLERKDAFIEQLKEALILERNRQFAAASESLRSLQSDLFNEPEQEQALTDATDIASACPEETDAITVPAHQRRRGGRKPLPADLPRVDVIHDLPADEKICPHDGAALKEINTKVTEQLDIIPMQIQVIRHIRKQYACPCCAGYLKTASRPKQPIEKSQASPGLLAFVAVSKYADGLPLYRQSTLFSRFDIEMDRTTLSNWMVKCGQLVQPLINRIEDNILSAPYIHVDETTVQVLNEVGKSAQSKSYMWVRSAGLPGKRLILFDYDPSRSRKVPERLLADYHGTIMVDGYEAYESVCRAQSIVRLGCWAHARRPFAEASKAAGKKKVTKADYALKQIAKLYQLEKQLVWDRHPHLNDNEWEDYRYSQRQELAAPILTKLKEWLDQMQPGIAPQTALGKALGYLQNQWPRLIRYLEDGCYPIDNNPVENAIRPFAIGRKNWLFSTSVQGAKASANLYGLIETAKANGIEPYAYLKMVFTELPNIVDYDDVDRLLPFGVK